MVKYFKLLISAILAGIFIGIGGTVYLSVDNKIAGSFLFSIGLLVICAFGFDLFTGRICYVTDHDMHYTFQMPIIYIGNFLGTGFMYLLMSNTRFYPNLYSKAYELYTAKVNDTYLSLFILGILCNALIYIAVHLYFDVESILRYLKLFLPVMVFILCGFEHCVADMYYFWLAGWTKESIIAILFITLGNIVGGIYLPLCIKYIKK